MKLRTLSKREANSLVEEIRRRLKIQIKKPKIVKILEIDDNHEIIAIDENRFVKVNHTYAPFLAEQSFMEKFPFLVVDKGAIPYVCNGANVMRPGIVEFPIEFKEDDIVMVKEQTYGKYIAVGKAIYDKRKAEMMSKGPILRNLHYVGDKIWEAYKEAKRKL